MTEWPRFNMAGGPVEVPERTRRDLSKPVLYHYDPAFKELFAHTQDLLKQVYRTEYDVIMMQGEAILGLEAAAASLIAPGDKVLNLVSGVFGKWFQLFIDKFGGETIELAVPYNDAIDPDEVRKALNANPGVKYLSVVHSETPSGTHNPVKEIGNIAREFGVLTLVDTVSGLGAEVLSPEDWGLDVAIAGPQKCLSGTPGLSLMAISPAAWEAMEKHPEAVARLVPLDPRLERRLAGGKSLSLHPVGQRDVRARIDPHPERWKKGSSMSPGGTRPSPRPRARARKRSVSSSGRPARRSPRPA